MRKAAEGSNVSRLETRLTITTLSSREFNLEIGILLLERRDPSQGTRLRSWMDNQILPTFKGRILAVDTSVAQTCAALLVPNAYSDREALLAAPPVHGMTVVTRHVSGFQATAVA